MKKILLIVLLLPVVCFAQYDSTKNRQEINAYGYSYKNLESRGSFILPKDTTKLAYADAGGLAYKNGTGYIWNGLRWGGFGVDTTSLSSRIDLRVKYSDTTSMLANYVRIAGWGLNKTGQTFRVDTSLVPSQYQLDTAKANIRADMGGGNNFFNANLRATGNRTHSMALNDLVIDSANTQTFRAYNDFDQIAYSELSLNREFASLSSVDPVGALTGQIAFNPGLVFVSRSYIDGVTYADGYLNTSTGQRFTLRTDTFWLPRNKGVGVDTIALTSDITDSIAAHLTPSPDLINGTATGNVTADLNSNILNIINGEVLISKLQSGGIAPVTSGTLVNVVSDTDGRLSFNGTSPKTLVQLITQTSTNAPTVDAELVNTTGDTYTWGYVNPGEYTLTAGGTPFTSNKTTVIYSGGSTTFAQENSFYYQIISTSVIKFYSIKVGAGGFDDILDHATIKIEIYP